MAKQLLKTLAGTSVLVLLLNVAAKGIGFLKELVFAGIFGVSASFEALLSASVFSTIVNTAVYYFTSNYFIPAYNRICAESGGKAGDEFISAGFWLYLSGATLFAGVCYFFAPLYTSLYFAPAGSPGYTSYVSIFRWYLLSLPVSAAAWVLTAYALAKFRYTLAIAAQVLPNATVIIASLLLGGTYGVSVIPIAFISGMAMLYALLHIKNPSVISFTAFSPRAFLSMHGKGLFYTMLIEVIGQFYVLVDRGFLNRVPEGGIAALSYAFVLFMLPITVFSMTLTTVFFPKFAEGLQNPDKSEVTRYLILVTGLNILFFLPVQAAFMVFGREVVTLFYARGGFGPLGVALTTDVLFWYAASIVLMAVYSVCNRFIYGAGGVRFLFWLTLAVILVKYLLNVLLVGSYAHIGLALATAICYSLFSIASVIYIRVKIGITGWGAAGRELMVALLPLGAALLAAHWLHAAGIPWLASPPVVLTVFAASYIFLLYQTGSTVAKFAFSKVDLLLRSALPTGAGKV